MNSRLYSTALALLLLTTACQPKTSDTTSEVQLASDEDSQEVGSPLSASFMSDQKSFAYTLHYDGALMQIVDGQFEGAGVVGPSFSVSGGAQIIVQSRPIVDVLDLEQRSGPAQEVSGQTVYHLSETVEACAVDTTVVPVSVEALVMTLKICDGQDPQLGQLALFDLLKQLEVKAL